LTYQKKLKEFLNNEGKSGVYIFINKDNKHKYVGSSISLKNRLASGYFIPKLGKRKIELVITEFGLNNFYLEIYKLPENLIKDISRSDLKNLCLSLEQILILKFNPEYNILKVAGSGTGLTKDSDAILSISEKLSKPVYLYDEFTKEYIFKCKNQKEFTQILGRASTNIARYTKNNKLFWNRFIISNVPLDNYEENIMDHDTLQIFIDEVILNNRKMQMAQVDETRKDLYALK